MTQPLTQPLSWNEIQNRAARFAATWQHAAREEADAKPFWVDFFSVFGIAQRKVSSFEERVHMGHKDGKIDLLWKGVLLIEHKSRGKDLRRAYNQALDYFPGLKDHELPRYVLVCDFERFELHDLEPWDGTSPVVHRFTLAQFAAHIHLFGFMAGYQLRQIRETDPINQQAVEAIGDLHDALKANGYDGEPLQAFLVRLLFCLFADDTGIFQPKDAFHDLLEYHTREDGADMGAVLQQLFETLNQKTRQKNLAQHFANLPYVNGKLFEKHYPTPQFDAQLRVQLLALCGLDWGAISPAIFGAMFQTVIELEASDRRRQLGAHYTSEANILKVLGPLFMDELRKEFDAVKSQQNQLFEFHKKLRSLTFLDPACGCGNFLVVAYRELRLLELDVLRAASQFGTPIASVFDFLQVNVDQFYGIEIEEFPAHVAQVAMWLTDHQMNLRAGQVFGEYIMRIPLEKSANIRRGNALEIDWAEFVPPTRLSYILGNPPFLGKNTQSKNQKNALEAVTVGMKNAGLLDFVAGWYIKAARYISDVPDGFGGIAARASKARKQFEDVQFGQSSNLSLAFADPIHAEIQRRRAVRCAFVSTNSITQGEQVGVLWGWLLAQGIHIQFAHRTFQWSNDAPGKAAVHCVIVGFGMEKPTSVNPPRLFDYEDIKGEPHEVQVGNINPYLVDAATVVVSSRREPICDVPALTFGSMPNDGGWLLLSDTEKKELLQKEPAAKPWVKRFLGAEEFLNDVPRWCLWLKDCSTADLTKMPEILARVGMVKKHRQQSVRETTRDLADMPARFGEERQPTRKYLLIPRVSSELRRWIPMAFVPASVIASDATFVMPAATLYHFGILTSTMHMAWMRYICGRLESRYRYSAGIVYNNFPWPQTPSDKAQKRIEQAAQAVLDARAVHQTGRHSASLATLYDPLIMPVNLVQAHRQLDRAVDAAYAACGMVVGRSAQYLRREFKNDAQRVAFLFDLYAYYTHLV